MAGIPPLPPGVVVADAGEGTETNPLLNPVVLKRLFELIPFDLEDFRRFRLVSQAWNNLSLSKWRQNAWLALENFQSPPEEEEDDGDSDYEDVDDDEEEEITGITRQKYVEHLVNDEHQLMQHPFRKYFIKNWDINFQSKNLDNQDQPTFWNKVGPLMTHLVIEKCQFNGEAELRQIIFVETSNLQSLSLVQNLYVYRNKLPVKKEQRLDPKLPQHALIAPEEVQKNLKEFDIDLVIREETRGEVDEERAEQVVVVQCKFPITWMELLIHFPNIGKLGPLQLAAGFAVETDLLELFESIEILRKEHGPHYLQNLYDLDLMQETAPSARSGTFISCLNRLQFPLKQVALAIGPSADEEVFKKLLQGFVNTLEHLCVARESNYAAERGAVPFQNFPFGLKFIALRELILGGPIAPNLMFLKDCPNLEMLRFVPTYEDGLEADLTQVLESDGSPTQLEKLKDLCITNDGCSAEEVRKLGQLMPNMRSLRIGLNSGSFRALCGVWKQLEHLIIVPFRVEEEALLGKDEQGGELFFHPNLTHLKNLKWFHMEDIEKSRDRQGLTEAVILSGIMALPNLEMVNLCLSSEVTWQVRNELERKFPKCHISAQEGAPGGNEWAAMAAQFQRDLRLGAL